MASCGIAPPSISDDQPGRSSARALGAMATELLSPILARRGQSFAVAAAAPFVLLLLAVVTFSCSPVAAASSPEIVELTLLAGAREKGAGIYLVASLPLQSTAHVWRNWSLLELYHVVAVCLDGSPPGYHLQRGFGSGAHSWLVYLQVTHSNFFSQLKIDSFS